MTGLGTFQAIRVDGGQGYERLTGRLDLIKDQYQASEWYVCGYGLVRAVMSHAFSHTGQHFEGKSELNLVSFEPLPD